MVDAGRVNVPKSWQAALDKLPTTADVRAASSSPIVRGEVDYRALVAAVEKMDPSEFAGLDIDALAAQYSAAGARGR
ncbi:hypothetical protein MNEG_9650 [Monoraphidium neglectum]|uniref:Uncharacterized protein n=1 Tax=Monoraphidium neglectum TaxID=145388 RepID=A0A0D2MVD4_9CHLO|nr:hypothetical protein MNEG_9650 [Monoraphidium neglectum]KIY98310.1 hypothetical protein MNEG_9650 [Monoraphidium neglectum]|eukprot:XP_013897330.1 hypothetical protein MNEG_9650 [Monoraphidium neglectum]